MADPPTAATSASAPPDPVEEGAVDPGQGLEAPALPQLTDVGTGRENAWSACEDRGPGIAFNLGADPLQVVGHRRVDGIADLRPVKGDHKPVAVLIDLKAFIGRAHHASSDQS